MISPWQRSASTIGIQLTRWKQLSIAVAWMVFLVIHILALVTYGAAAYGYSILRGSDVSYWLDMYRIGISIDSYPITAVSFGAVAFAHAWFISDMIILSIRHRRLTFARRARKVPPKSSGQIRHYAGLFYVVIFTRNGLFGVEGPCFDLLLLSREVLETMLQAIQAYRMSLFLSRMWLNRLYVGLLVLNCWTVAAVHTIFHHASIRRHFVALLSDLSLDIAASIGVPLALIAVYWKDVNPNASNLFGDKWFDDVWIYNASYELQLALVVSLGDLATRILFAVGTISTLNTLKGFISFSIASSVSTRKINALNREQIDKRTTSSMVLRRLQRTNEVVKANPVMSKLLCLGFILCGAALLLFHLVAEFEPSSSLCLAQVRPWGIFRPSCHLALVDCSTESINGSMIEIHDRLDPLYSSAVVMLMVRHCPAFEMPVHIQAFSNLITIKMYNTTIENWSDDAAVTAECHHHLNIIVFIRTQFKDGLLPLGLQHQDFPTGVKIIAFIVSNIRELPDDLDTKWTPGSILHFDTTRLNSLPSVLIRLSPTALALGSNPIGFVPSELFEIPTLEYLDLRSTLITAIPDNVTYPARNLQAMNFDGDAISFFPSWIDKWLTFPGDPLFSDRISAAGSPYCKNREQIFSGKLTAFTDQPNSLPSKLMDASFSNWRYLKFGVTCTPTEMYRYPIDLEDFLQSTGR